jgi:hypothetical protein
MKNNLSPGSSGLSAYFYNVFFFLFLKKRVYVVTNNAHESDKLYITQTQGIFTRIPKN